MKSKEQLRAGPRTPAPMSVRVVWQDKLGRDKFATVRSVDISNLGIRIEMPEPIEARSIVTLQSQQLGLHGSGSVRHCARKGGGKYVIGLEFVGGLRYQVPENHAASPATLESLAASHLPSSSDSQESAFGSRADDPSPDHARGASRIGALECDQLSWRKRRIFIGCTKPVLTEID